MDTSQPRRLNEIERQLIGRLLEANFPGRDTLLEQVDHSLVTPFDTDGSLSFDVQTTVAANVTWRVPTEGEFKDADGVTIHVLLHVVNGFINELEIFKEDGSAVVRMPNPSELQVIHLD